MNKIKMIVAVDEEYGIGKQGRMAWHHSEDFKHFKEYTKDSVCVMGRNTYRDIVGFKKQLTGDFLDSRYSVVLTTVPDIYHNACTFSNISFVEDLSNTLPDLFYYRVKHSKEVKQGFYDVSIIGGKSIYEKFINAKVVSEIAVTEVKGVHNCDVFLKELPQWLEGYNQTDEKTISNNCTVKIYNRSDYYETQ